MVGVKRERLDALARNGFALDTETYLIIPGNVAPALVVGSAAEWRDGAAHGVLLDKATTRAAFEMALANQATTIIAQNAPYDMLVLAVDAARRGIDLMPQIFAAYESGRVYDIGVAEQLHAIAQGTLMKDPRTGVPLRDPETNKQAGYSLSVLTDIVLGRTNAKANDTYRKRYGELDAFPIEDWPTEAKVYPVDDAINTLEVALAQTGHIPRPGPHRFADMRDCSLCGASPYESAKACVPRKERNRNSHEIAIQAYTHFAMHLGAAWGFVVDHDAADALERSVLDGHADRSAPFFAAGVLKKVKKKGVLVASKDQATIKAMVARAYGCTESCGFCDGKGRVPANDPKGKPKKNGKKCAPCDGTGLALETAPVPRTDGSKCKPCGTTGVLETGEECEECNGTGVTQGVGMGADVLAESGDETLMNFGAHTALDKVCSTYLPWLRNRDKETGLEHRDAAVTLQPRVLLETGRTSYGGVVQLLPRDMGVRECIVARQGRVLCSTDYEAGELITHAQSCIWIVGVSKLAMALNAGVKVHNAFAATVLGLSYEEYQRRFAAGDQRCKDVRQAAKPANFGFPGRMGAAALVLQQRGQGPDTPCEGGSTWITTENGARVRGYRGLRFCVMMDGRSSCGSRKIAEHKGRTISPTCADCIDCAERLRAKWLEQWPENVDYFEYVKHCEEHGQPLTPAMVAAIGESKLGPGEIAQHVANRIRGGANGNAISNGWFQGLLSDLAKHALRCAVRECYDHTVRVDGEPSPLYGTRCTLFAHDEILSEMPEDTAHEAGNRMSAVMVESMKQYCPDLANAARAEPALMRRWFKGATPTFKDGRLVPWEPKSRG